MLAEALLHATARSWPALRQRGLIGDAVALWSRAGRRRREWVPHEERCRAAVLAGLADLPRRHTALVLGSGLLRDVPVAELARAFRRVVLVDAVHLLPARLRARRLGCTLQVADLTESEGLADWQADADVDLVVSANLLSQLPMSRLRAVESEDEATIIRRRIGAAHLAALAGFRARAVLLSDTSYRDVAPDGTVLDEVALVDPSLLAPSDEAWDWEVAPRGEISRRFARIHRVGAWLDFRPRHAPLASPTLSSC